MITTKWIELPSFRLSQLPNIGNHQQVFRSPYDVPDALRATYDSEKGLLALDFHYMTPEPQTKTIDVQPDLQFTLGRNSGNIYGIVVQVKSTAALAHLPSRLGESLKELAVKRPANSENYHVVAQVVHENSNALLPIPVGA
jgi:hypothetical protein